MTRRDKYAAAFWSSAWRRDPGHLSAIEVARLFRVPVWALFPVPITTRRKS